MKVYHGSKLIIAKPEHRGSKKDNDYGSAFYLTRDLNSAGEWACRNNTAGFINKYQLTTNGLKILDLTKAGEYSVLNWIAILLHFRSLDQNFVSAFRYRLDFIESHYYIDVNQYDMIVGFRADDAYFRFPLDFVRGNLTLEQLSYSFNLGSLGIQYALISEKAIKHLKYIGSLPADRKYINSYFENIKRATDAFDSLNKDTDGIRIQDIMRGNK